MRCVVNATIRSLFPRERSGTYCVGGWVGPRDGLEGCGKSHPPPGFDSRSVQSLASRYTDCAIRTPTTTHITRFFFVVLGDFQLIF
jgi:hypothetical protein